MLLLLSMQALGQPAIPTPTFDAASVKPSDPAARGSGIFGSQGEFTAKKRTLNDLIMFAYDIRGFQRTGGPAWLDTDTYDITAKPGGTTTRAMLQTLLAERYKLTIHRETRTLPVYHLVIAKYGHKLGQPTAGKNFSISNGTFKNVDLALLAKYLSSQVDHVVIDKTGITGSYDFTLQWAPEPPTMPSDAQPARETSPDNPPIFTALQEQLGLKLEPSKGPVEIIVIDHAQKPTAN